VDQRHIMLPHDGRAVAAGVLARWPPGILMMAGGKGPAGRHCDTHTDYRLHISIFFKFCERSLFVQCLRKLIPKED
jgi:hypothetical protein